MQVKIKHNNELLSSREIDNCERLCQLISDIYAFFLPRKGKLKVTVKTGLREHAVKVENPREICGLFNQIWGEWRFEDEGFKE